MTRGSNGEIASVKCDEEIIAPTENESEEFSSSISTAFIKSLGESLRDARTGRFTIEELAQKSHISAGRISQIERGIANPSFETLWRLTTALGIPIRALFPVDGVEKRQVVRKQERRRLEIPRDGLIYEMLTPNGNGALEIFLLDIPAGYDGGARRFLTHEGEKFIHVLDGKLTVRVADEEWTLLAGDCITFAAVEPHFVRNDSKRSTRIELVVTPPSF